MVEVLVRQRSYEEVVNLFKDTNNKRNPINELTVYRTINRFERTSFVRDKPYPGSQNMSSVMKSFKVSPDVIKNRHIVSVRNIKIKTLGI